MTIRPALKPPAPWTYPAPEVHALPTGLRIAVHSVPGQQIVSAHLVLDIPLSAEERDLEGVAAICARTLDEGTRTHPGERFAEVLEIEGAAFGAHQGYSGLQLMMDVPASRLTPALELFADAVRRPEFRDADVARHVALRLAELEQLEANSAQLASRQFRRLVFDAGGRVARLAGGEPESVARVTPEAVRDFHRRHYGPRGAMLVLAGDFVDDPLAAAERAFGEWAADTRPTGHHAPRPGQPSAVLVHRADSVQADVRLGGFGIDRHDPRWPAFQIGSYAVGGAFLSRLNKVLREDRGYTYGVRLQNSPLRTGGSYAVAGSFRTEVVAPALAEARSLLDISGKPIAQAEVSDAVNYFAGANPLRFATAEGIADQTASNVADDLPLDFVDRYLDGIRAVTPDSAQQAYAQVVDLDRLSLVVVGDADQLHTPLTEAGFAVEVR